MNYSSKLNDLDPNDLDPNDPDANDLENIDDFIRQNIDMEKKRLADYQALNNISLSEDVSFPYNLAEVNIFDTYKELHLVYEANKDRMVEQPKFPKREKTPWRGRTPHKPFRGAPAPEAPGNAAPAPEVPDAQIAGGISVYY